MEHIANRSDESLQDAVIAALRGVLSRVAPHIGVSANRGTVTLTGEVLTEMEKQAAHTAVLGVWGIHSIANDILVRDVRSAGVTDTDIASAAQAALWRADDVPKDVILAEVSERVVTLSGTVTLERERLAAERAVSYLRGVVAISNHVAVAEPH
jgi:osmotically-inducible protein OsmY